MIGYVTIGTNDLARASGFYATVLAELGGKKLWANDRMTAFGSGPAAPMILVTKPYDGQSAHGGNGNMVALSAKDVDQVAKVHAKALAAGAKDEGAPGPRGDSGFYGAYFRDADGNKVCAFCMVKKQG